MTIYCSITSILRFALWAVVAGIVAGILLTYSGTPAPTGPVSTAGYAHQERGCTGNADT
ncbi:hypothetical protein EV192_102810 [Actinocrispum wychmicini]|uniref:Uncharacterized protein n=1 Tax=Actinocrispum wychmicini TaxID=1213861 RepID=A0A4R2JQZ8_9PSEU|nr:hypothetical protein EV192_102810 [Actinocrispum wychmicini]